MRLLARIILFIFLLLLTFWMHVFFIYTLPFPFRAINTIFVVLFFVLWWRESGSVVWISFFVHLLTEFVSDLPFGITVFSGTVSMLVGYWLYVNVFTNRSWYAISLLLVVTIALFRLSFILLLLVHVFLFDSHFSFTPIIQFTLWEAGITTGIFLLTSAAVSRLFFRFRPERIR